MNRNDLMKLARVRHKEARFLLNNKCYSGAYYLSGYTIECALKACIAKQTRKYDFPDKQTVNQSYTHDLTILVKTSGLETALKQEMQRDKNFEVNWSIVKDWNEMSRYNLFTEQKARDLYSAISNRQHGVLKWIKQYW